MLRFAQLRKRIFGDTQFATGALWSVVNTASGIGLPFVAFAVFARHLEPTIVGIVVLAASIAEVVKALGLPGLYEALLNSAPDMHTSDETAAALLWCLGLLLFAFFAAIVGVLGLSGTFSPVPTWMLTLLGLRIPLDLVAIQPQAVLARRLATQRLALRSAIANVGALGVALPLVFGGSALAGLLAYLVSQSVLGFLVTVAGTQSLARPRLDRSTLSDLLPQAWRASVVRLVAATNNSLDQALLGGMLGATSLAYFNIGKRMEAAFMTAASAFSAILYQPLFSNRPRAARPVILGRGLALASLSFGVPSALFVTNAEWFVTLLFGRAWAPAAPTASLLAVSGFARALGSVHGALLSASGRNHSLMIASLCSAISGLLLVAGLAQYGSVAIAAGLVAKNSAITAWLARLTRTDAPPLPDTYARHVAFPLIAALLCGLAAHGITGTGGGR